MELVKTYIKNFNTNKLYYLLLLLLIPFIIYIFYYKKPEYVDEYESKIKILNTKIDFLNKENIDLNKKIKKYKSQIYNINKNIFIKDNEIKKLKIKTNEKIKYIDYLTDSELERFFTNRYKTKPN